MQTPAVHLVVLTIQGSVVAVCVHPLVGQDLDVFPAGSAVQLVGSGQPAAHSVRQSALLGDMVLEIRRRLCGVLSDNRKHMSRSMKLRFNLVPGEEGKMLSAGRSGEGPGPQFIMSFIRFNWDHPVSPSPLYLDTIESIFWRCFQGPSGMTIPLWLVVFTTDELSPLPDSFSHRSRPPSTCVLTITFSAGSDLFSRCLKRCQTRS